MAILSVHGRHHGSMPKGVMLTPPERSDVGTMAALYMEMSQRDSTCFVLPNFHVSCGRTHDPAPSGAAGVCIVRKPNLDAIFKLIQDEKCHPHEPGPHHLRLDGGLSQRQQLRPLQP